MAFVKKFYRIVFFIVTSLHNFLVTFAAIVEKLNAFIRRPKTLSVPVGVNECVNECVLMQSAGSELKKRNKLPTHIACLLTEDNIDIERTVSLVRWCTAAGIKCISLYDHDGTLRFSQFHIITINRYICIFCRCSGY